MHKQADVDVGGPGTGLLGIPMTESAEHAKKRPYAVRYLKCSRDRKDLCDDHKYNAQCWIHRPDVKPQRLAPGGQSLHHPGFWSNQLTGRVLVFPILMAFTRGIATVERGTELLNCQTRRGMCPNIIKTFVPNWPN